MAAALLALVVAAACDGGGPGSGDAPGAAPRSPTSSASPSSRTPSPSGAPGGRDAPGSRVVVADQGRSRAVRGSAPRFVEIAAASVSGSATTVRMELRLTDALPSSLPRGATVRAAFQILTEDRRRYSFEAQRDVTGWTGVATGPEGSEAIPGTIDTGPRSIVMTVERSYMGPPAPFRWLASITWSKGSDYAFDSVPTAGYARWPQP